MPKQHPDLFGAPDTPAPTPASTPVPHIAPKSDPTRYDIPALRDRVDGQPRVPKTRGRACTGSTCAELIYWIFGRNFPVSINFDGGRAPTETEPGVGISHFLNCPNVAEFSGRNRGGAK